MNAEVCRSMAALSHIARLTSLSVKEARTFMSGAQRRSSNLDYWSMLAALPQLARLSLDVPISYHAGMPAVSPLKALTHLEMQCAADMLEQQQQGVPVAQVRNNTAAVLVARGLLVAVDLQAPCDKLWVRPALLLLKHVFT
jgi:hypothetical protein